MRRTVVFVTLLSSGCLSRGEITLPEPGPDAQSLIVHLHTGAQEELWVMRPGDPLPVPVDRAWPTDANMRAYALPWSVEALQLPVGAFPGGLRGDRILPTAQQSWRGQWADNTLGWRPSPDTDDIQDLRWPTFDWDTCLESQGCAPNDAGGPPRCTRSCAARSPQLPSPPDAPQGSIFVESTGSPYATRLADRRRCANLERQAYGDSECSALGPCASDWPQPPAHSGQTWYVSAGGGGLGTAASPFPTLGDALAVFRPGDAVLLDEGDFVVPTNLTQDGLILQGRCAARTSIGLDLESVQLSGANIQLLDVALPEVRVVAGHAALQRVVWTQTASSAMQVVNAEASLRDALIVGAGSAGIVATGATVQIDNVVVRDTIGGALVCREQSVCAASHLAVRGARLREGITQAGVVAQASDVSLDGFIVEDCEIDGLRADLDGKIEAEEGLLRGFSSPGAQTTGIGARAMNNATLELQNVMIDGAQVSALRASNGALLRATDVVVQNTTGEGASTFFVVRGAHARALRLFAFEPEAAFSYTFDRAGSFEISDARMISTARESVVLQSLLHLDAAINRLSRVRLTSGGAKVIDTTPDAGAEIHLQDVTTQGGFEALRVNRNNHVIADRVVLTGATERGLVVSTGADPGADPEGGPARLTATNLSVIGSEGSAIEIMVNGIAEIERFEVKAYRADIGVTVQDLGRLRLKQGKILGPTLGILLQEGALTQPQDVLTAVYIEADTRIAAQ